MKAFDGIRIKSPDNSYKNPEIDLDDPKIKSNIKNLWKGGDGLDPIPREWRISEDTSYLGLDVRMETGTGKTYCYTRMMYELNRKYGFHKFIILVPSVPIREGTRNFIEADYSKRHFNDLYINQKLSLSVLEAQRSRSKGKKYFPGAVSEFVRGSSVSKNWFSVLLMGSGMFNSKATMDKNDYDETVLGNITRPYDALEYVRPIVIIDEPHRFKKSNATFKNLIKELDPQCIIRFGATFPQKKKSKVKDFNNLIFNLGPSQAFNRNLVKGVETYMIDAEEENENKIKLMDLKLRPRVAKIRNETTKETKNLEVGDNLSVFGEEFSGIYIENIESKPDQGISRGVVLSNGQILAKGDIAYGGIYSKTYQELMLKQSIKNHFEIEKKNFFRANKIKTLSLYFIDSVNSYRAENDEHGHLRIKFQDLLRKHIKKELDLLSDNPVGKELEYKEYLEASLDDIDETNGGYFSKDNASTDKDIKDEVDKILKDKNYLLDFKSEDGSWNTKRFIFSKWTLKEGWDNPNVFQIVKLRSSGSEISKLQEVGRGLRLPVDENGDRIDNEQFYLRYMIDYSERDFANKLINEINGDLPNQITNIKEILPKISETTGISIENLFADMLIKKYIDTDGNINDDKLDLIYEEYPQAVSNLKSGKVLDARKQKKYVKVRKDKFDKIADLWKKINQKYYLKIDEIDEGDLQDKLIEILGRDIYRNKTIDTLVTRIDSVDGKMLAREDVEDSYITDDKLKYGDFLKILNKQTGLPIKLIHKSLCEYNKKYKIEDKLFTHESINFIAMEFHSWLDQVLLKRFSYEMLDVDIKETKLTDYKGDLIEELPQGVLGVHKDFVNEVPDKFIYDSIIFDSPKEKENIVRGGNRKVVVFGKIPRKSVQIPLFTGGTTSPDFMYLVESDDGKSQINFIVETKGVDSKSSLRGSEKIAIESAKKFFETMKKDGVNVVFKEQLNHEDIVSMINELG